MNSGGDNENEDDDDDDDDDDEDVNDFEASAAQEVTVTASEIVPAAASIPDDRPKKRAKFDDGMKTKNSKPTQSNSRGGIAGTIAELASTISSNQQMNIMMEMMNKQQQSSDRMMQMMMMMMMMMMGGKFPPASHVTPSFTFPHEQSITTSSSSIRSAVDNANDVSDVSNELN